MGFLCAQGDILVERVGDVEICGHVIECVTYGSVVVAGGEKAGHHHRVIGSVTLFRDAALAHDIPGGLYTLHLQVHSVRARLHHEEHAPITLTRGTYVSDVNGNWSRRILGSTNSTVCLRIDAHAGRLA